MAVMHRMSETVTLAANDADIYEALSDNEIFADLFNKIK